jgi:hypothetical protein
MMRHLPTLEGALVSAIGKPGKVSPAGLLTLAACATAAALLVAAAGSAEAATGQTKLTVYSVPDRVQYINKEDDRERAVIRNPFNVDTAKLVDRQKIGPFAGDTTLYSFKLYATASRGKRIGSAVYTCDYNFAQQALCSAYFVLNGGTLLAAGPVNFNAKRFTLAVTGGTRKYSGSNGEVAMTPVTNSKQRLNFVLLTT